MNYQLSSNGVSSVQGCCRISGEEISSPSLPELPLTLPSRYRLYCLSLRRWSSLNRTPAPPSVCTLCSMWTLGTRSTPTGTTTTCRSVPALSRQRLELAVNSKNVGEFPMSEVNVSVSILL